MTWRKREEWLCNFQPEDRPYYNRVLEVAESLGYEAWIHKPLHEHLPGAAGFYVSRAPFESLTPLWEEVEKKVESWKK